MKTLIYVWVFSIGFGVVQQANKGEEPVRFYIKNAGITVEGTITDWEFDLHWDAKKPANNSISGLAKVASLNTGIKLRDQHLQGRQYFRSDKYPHIKLQSKSIEPNGNGQFKGVFDLQIKELTKEIEIPFSVKNQGSKLVFEGEFSLNRLDFGLGEKSLVLADDVRVVLKFQVDAK